MFCISNSNGPCCSRLLSVAMRKSLMGIYIHIPFCIQRCHYCDFATYSKDQIAPNTEYVDTLLLEAQKRVNLIPNKNIDSIYFGGGTPSLLPASEIKRIIDGLKNLELNITSSTEITIEVNPATLTDEKCKTLKESGVNRISIGCQSFDDEHLKRCNREHSVADTMRTIDIVKKYFNNYSLDLLFSLPEQQLEGVYSDLQIIKKVNPPHVSAYCLTVADKHPMNQGRCSDEEQLKMFDLIQGELSEINHYRYEISNFSRPGFESIHNSIYWTDQPYWGLGLSAHSYFNSPDWGYRFWNSSTYKAYLNDIQNLSRANSIEGSFSSSQFEKLRFSDSLSDFCHTHMRLSTGLNEHSLRQKFGEPSLSLVSQRMSELISRQLVEKQGDFWTLSHQGITLSNQVFAKLLFSPEDIDN